jgi:hypothetical protein
LAKRSPVPEFRQLASLKTKLSQTTSQIHQPLESTATKGINLAVYILRQMEIVSRDLL